MKFELGLERRKFVAGLIVGLLVGLVLALAVAMYVSKVPVPFVNKLPQRSAEQDAAEKARNKDWNPNEPLAGKTPAHAASLPAPTPLAKPPMPAVTGTAPTSARDPAAILSGQAAPLPAASSASAAAAFSYFVQTGAYSRSQEAEQQRARLAMAGFAARITEREQAGRTVYRVRVGPLDRQDEAESVKGKLLADGFEATLVRVQK